MNFDKKKGSIGMVTDTVCEHLVSRKPGKSDIVKSALIAVAALIISAVVFLKLQSLGLFMLLIIAGVIYLAFWLIKKFTSVEYEYSFVNGELTIDKIVSQSDRKNVITIETKKIEKAGRYSVLNAHSADRILNCASSDEPEDGVFFQLRDESGSNTTVVISCPDEYIEKMKPYFNQLVYREAFRN